MSWRAIHLDRAAGVVRQILAAPPQVFLSDEQSREIDALLSRAEQSLADLEVHV